jgi:hypothetical protein
MIASLLLFPKTCFPVRSTLHVNHSQLQKSEELETKAPAAIVRTTWSLLAARLISLSGSLLYYLPKGDPATPGNDYPVAKAGVQAVAVRGPEETKPVIKAIVACLSRA